MKKSIFRAFLGFALFFSLMACNGSFSDEEVPPGTLRIFADKTTIAANGAETVTFKVMYGSEDVTSKPTLTITVSPEGKDEYNLPASSHAFSTAAAGRYTFTAVYYYGGNIRTDNSVTVTATQTEGGTSAYYQKLLGMQFTSVGCSSCPNLSATIKNLQADFPGRISPVAFHLDFAVADPMKLSINDVFFSKVKLSDGLPQFAFNVRKNTEHIISEYTKIVSEMNHQLETFPAICGVAVGTTLSDGKLEVEAKITPDVATEFRCHVFLLEDGLEEYDQMGTVGDQKYIHNNVLRYCVADNVWGVRLNSGSALEAGKEFSQEFTIKLDNDWDTSNMRVLVCAMTSSDGGVTFACNNLNECPLGQSADYLYNENAQ